MRRVLTYMLENDFTKPIEQAVVLAMMNRLTKEEQETVERIYKELIEEEKE